jgi:hypothetical protein
MESKAAPHFRCQTRRPGRFVSSIASRVSLVVVLMTGERLIEKPKQRLLDLVKVVLMHTVEQATVDKSANVVGPDLDRYTKKAAVAAIAMPSLTDSGSRFIHDHSPLGP